MPQTERGFTLVKYIIICIEHISKYNYLVCISVWWFTLSRFEKSFCMCVVHGKKLVVWKNNSYSLIALTQI